MRAGGNERSFPLLSLLRDGRCLTIMNCLQRLRVRNNNDRRCSSSDECCPALRCSLLVSLVGAQAAGGAAEKNTQPRQDQNKNKVPDNSVIAQ